MNYLLDTNVVSEWVKPQPDIGVIEWLEQIDEDRAFICAVTIAELRYGIERLAQGSRSAHVSPRTRQVFRKLRPLLLKQLSRAADPDATLWLTDDLHHRNRDWLADRDGFDVVISVGELVHRLLERPGGGRRD